MCGLRVERLWGSTALCTVLMLGAAAGAGARPVNDAVPAGRARLVAAARAAGVSDQRVLDALGSIPREEFVPESERGHADEDRSLPIEEGQRITQPSLVALMTQLLEVEDGDKILEVGTGSGYQAALLARLTPAVYSIELLPGLAAAARQRLARLGFSSVRLRTGDGYLGWPEEAPFDAILVTCAPDRVPPPLVEQLREGGRIVIPLGPDDGPQTLYLLRKQEGKLVATSIEPVHFVPFVHDGPRDVVEAAPVGRSKIHPQLFAFLFSLVVEIPVALLCCARDRRSALATLGAALMATGITHPFAWGAISWSMGALTWGGATLLVETVLTGFEAVVYRNVVAVAWRRAIITSLIANAASFTLGQLAWRLFPP